MRVGRTLPGRLGCLLVVASIGLATVAGPVAAQSADEVATAAAEQRAVTILAPGNSMTFTVDGQAGGMASGEPDDFGDHVDDQREMYWDHEFKDGRFVDGCDEPEEPRPGVEICWSGFGVPAVFADTTDDLAFGTGWAHAKLRLFLTDAIRRTARGTLSELAGPGADDATLAEDVRTRHQTYGEDELTAMYERAGAEEQAMIAGYVDGVNARIAAVTSTASDQLPAEYALLQTVPEPLTVEDVVATGVLMTRFVASEGKREFMWVRALRALEETHGTELGRAIFSDFVWEEDASATTTVLADEGTFPRTGASTDEREAAFEAMADHAAGLPHDLDRGPGADPDSRDPVPAGAGKEEPDEGTGLPVAAPPSPGARAVAALEEWRAALTGGSWQVSLGPSMTADGSTLLISEPQLGYNPTLLVEFQMTGAGYDVRGVGVPGLPVVGIGYTPTVAWSLTTGNSKTIDTFVETLRPDSNGDGAPEVLHGGAWKDLDCRTETIRYRAAPEGVPTGPPVQSRDETVCVGPHGPVVSPAVDEIDDPDGQPGLAYQWHMRDREVDTIEGVLQWMRARTADDIVASIDDLTWNENIGWADAFGHIGWWHPGTHLAKAPGTDLRLPTPGTGEFDNGEPLPVDALPHVVDPPRGWIANWNNQPAHGWRAGGGQSETSTPAGIDDRIATLHDAITSRDDWTFDDLVALDRRTSSQDVRARHFLAMLLELRGDPALDDTARAALELLAAWDGSANGPGADMEFAGFDAGDAATTVGAPATIFDRVMATLVDDLFADLRAPTYTVDGETFTFDLIGRQLAAGRHTYDMTPPLHVALRTLDPSTSSLGTAMDYAGGRSSRQVLRDVLQATVDDLADEQGDDPATWRQPYLNPSDEVCSPTGVIGPCGIMPFLERGTWIHYVGWPDISSPPADTPATHRPSSPPRADPPAADPPAADPPASAAVAGSGAPLPATGAGPGLLAVLLLLGAAAAGRRRRHCP